MKSLFFILFYLSAAWAKEKLHHSVQDVSETCNLTSTLPPITVTRCESSISTFTAIPVNTLVYTTAYAQFCSTGLESKTYTITETCDVAPCTTSQGTQIPPGFTVAVSTCQTCGSTPITATLTVPVPQTTERTILSTTPISSTCTDYTDNFPTNPIVISSGARSLSFIRIPFGLSLGYIWYTLSV